MNAQPGQRLLPQTILELVLGDGALALLASHTGPGRPALSRAIKLPESALCRLLDLAATLLWQLRELGQDPVVMIQGVVSRTDALIAHHPRGAAWTHAALRDLIGQKAMALLASRLRSHRAETLRRSLCDPEHRHYRLYALVVLALQDLAAAGRPARDALLSEMVLSRAQPTAGAPAWQWQEALNGPASSSVR